MSWYYSTTTCSSSFTIVDRSQTTAASSEYCDSGTSGYECFNQKYFIIPFQIPRLQQRSQPSPPRPTPEEEVRENARKEEIEIQERARRLLLEYLDQDNRQRYLENKSIEIVSKIFSDIRYQIPISKFDKICALKGGKVISRLCLIVKEPEKIPLEDVILTKLLYILNDEEYALRIANHSPVSENLLARLD